MELRDYIAIAGITVTLSSLIGLIAGWLFKVAHDRNMDAHGGIIGKVSQAENSAHVQEGTLQRIEKAVTAMTDKFDRFQQQYWEHRTERSHEDRRAVQGDQDS